jgi:hypothetical protein
MGEVQVVRGHCIYDSFGLKSPTLILLFLIAMAKITNQIRQTVKIVGYADDWTIFTFGRDMETAETNIKTALNGVAKWTRQKEFKISPEKTVCMHICRKRTHNHRDPEIQLNGRRMEIKDTHKILGLTFDSRLTCKVQMNETRAKAFS